MTQKIEPVCFDKSIEPLDPASVHQVELASGRMMPVAAFGTFHSDWAQDYMEEATAEAIRLGWRHLDTARAYENEDVVGEAIRRAIREGYIASPDELFITGKLWNGHMDPKDVAPALDGTLQALGVDKIDLYLNHWPWPNVHTPGCAGDHRNPDAVPYIHEAFLETWAEIVKLKKAGKIVDIGTSNHTEADMKLLLRDVPKDERPVCNQMEMHPLMQQTELRRYFESEGVVCTGYMSLGSPNRPARDTFKEHRADMMDRTIQAVAAELGVPPPKVCLAWAAQRMNKSGGFVAMATRSDWIRDNLFCAVADTLSPDQLLRISGDGTPEHPGIDANNRLIWGQVFLWPEADGDWRLLWDDSQVFETREGYATFKESWEQHHRVQLETTFRG
ncbi:MAG: aldo/keto reductase [Kiritimatiellia bacterium]|jgi:diketogulonate reductase-like aldo/keto reductase|nr:aldo/keto reductase [Kiritimatiellia bacterium]MDP6631062.1 aldo/keto reductase [Kiritimatiellia bacterium]MDP6810018.1 aldo/keto reductase [Kiritimatiellia bacterium]MDP7024789.1 aldo/keto reductase [Kiritimatiellia bacterium]